MKVVIVGGVAGGATTAARLRRLDEKAEVIIIERSGYISYANCGLPYYIGGEIVDKRSLTLQTPTSFFNRFNIDVRVQQEVTEIDVENKLVKVRNLVTDELYTESYDKLVLSPGAKAIIPVVDGIDKDNVFTLKTVENTYEIDEYIKVNNPNSVVIMGGGFIGLEMAENLVKRGMKVTIVEKSNHIMSNLDEDMVAIMQNYMRKNDIKLILNSQVTKISKGKVRINDSQDMEADMIILAIGVIPETKLAKEAGITLGINDAIITDTHMKTSSLDIYAVGDAVEVRHLVTGKKVHIPLAGAANKQGRIAADNICGIESEYKGSQGTFIMKMFDMTVASTGISMKVADIENIDSDCVVLTSASHATYYPGAKNMTVKVIFDKSNGKILGAQIVGYDGVDKRIDVLATAIRVGMTCYELEELELAYAPPYASAKDPVNMAGYAISNIVDGLVKQVHWNEIIELKDIFILDTRTVGEYDRGHIDGAKHIPIDSLRNEIDKLPKDKLIYVYCHSGLRSYVACRILSQLGYDCVNISGGYGYYESIKLNKSMGSQGTGPCGL